MRLLLLAVWLAMPLLAGCSTTTVDTAYENRDYAQPWLTPDWGETGIGGTHTTHRGK